MVHKPSTSTFIKPSGSTPSKSPGKCNTQLVDKEIEVLKERLEILKKQKALVIKEQELEDLQNASGLSCEYNISLVSRRLVIRGFDKVQHKWAC